MGRIRPSWQSRDFCLSPPARRCLKGPQPTGRHAISLILLLCCPARAAKLVQRRMRQLHTERIPLVLGGKILLLQKAEYLPSWEQFRVFSAVGYLSQEYCKSSQLVNIANTFEWSAGNGDCFYSRWSDRLAAFSLERILWFNGFWQAIWTNAKLEKAIIYGSSQMWVSVAAICSFLFATQPPLIMLFFMS